MSTNNNGLIYYKLDSELHGYNGDITKNCGLRGEEIDGNFNFLRGNDIEKIEFDENGTLLITKYNGDAISASIIEKPEKPEYSFAYNPENGVMLILTPNGEEIKLEGFNIAIPTPSSVYHDDTLTGNGQKNSLLCLNNMAKTGRFLPAKKLIDLTNTDENGVPVECLPTTNVPLHERYVTKENISRFGRLYPKKSIELITKQLNDINSEWRIPSKQDWDEMLNFIDCANMNHDDEESNLELGEFAGTLLKSTNFWKPLENGEILSQDTYGFNILPVGYCGNRGTQFYGSFSESTAFWTSTLETEHNEMYVKCFNYDKETVGQHTWGENFYLSIRLVKDFTGDNFYRCETINGFTCNCVHIPGTNLVWTNENISFSQEELESFVPNEWSDILNDSDEENSKSYRYYVNDWNGKKWNKHELKDGESIVIYDHEDKKMHEWMLNDGDLIDYIGTVLNHVNDGIKNLNDDLTEETSNRVLSDNKIIDDLSNEINQRQSDVDLINEQLNSISSSLTNEIEKSKEFNDYISEKLLTEIDDRISINNEIKQTIEVNKLVTEDSSVVIIPGKTNEENNITNTLIKVNLDPNYNNIKLGEDGLYFDGYFGQF